MLRDRLAWMREGLALQRQCRPLARLGAGPWALAAEGRSPGGGAIAVVHPGPMGKLYQDFYEAEFVVSAAFAFFNRFPGLGSVRDCEVAEGARRHGVNGNWIRRVKTHWGRKVRIVKGIEEVSRACCSRDGVEWTPYRAMAFAQEMEVWFDRRFKSEFKKFHAYVDAVLKTADLFRLEREASGCEAPRRPVT